MSKKALIELIKKDKTILEYQRLEKIIHKDEYLLKEILELKELQQELVNLQYLDKVKMLSQVKKKYQEKLNLLNKNPLLHNYLTLQNELNQLLIEIKRIIESGLKLPILEQE
ncbi:MAG: YlbF family regulator [Acholeplasmatales bacterium]|nr:YlbF family regulator [Acholeplasmataceae bacterium]MDY0115210.1 YlbF family regulator [Acholeplasmatales bacterium]MCK9288928.1 YlbF family regulator [Acholeplasmataceae bacterium]MCK9427522.1 YlbF family regulator [Acholeplasmataceae bacterium]MDD4090274.1 YlbF family regulator [Acholeplasmataceae bacterium]